jgi:hypothetical protein
MDTKSERLRDACELAAQTLRKVNPSDFHEIVSKLEFCIGSYGFDRNPAGLVEYGYKALDILKEIKKKQPRKISREVISILEDSLT